MTRTYLQAGEERFLRKHQGQSFPGYFNMDTTKLYQTTELTYHKVTNPNNSVLIINWMGLFLEQGIDELSS